MSDIVQVSFDYGLLTSDQAQRTQDRELRIIGRTQKAIIENGKDLLAVKQDIGHGHFRNWLQSIGVSHDTAERWINIAQNFGEMTPGASFAEKAMALLSTSKVPETAREEAKQRAAEGEKITEEVAKQIRDAHRAKMLAEEAQQKAEEKAKSTQLQLLDEQSQSRESIATLNQSISALQQEMADLKKPQEIIREVDKPETIARLKSLESEINKLTQQRENLSKLVDELNADLDANEAKREEEARILRVRQEWQKATDAMYKSVNQFIGKLPMPLDAQLFEPDEWAMLNQVIVVLQYGIQSCQQLQSSQSLKFVEAGITD